MVERAAQWRPWDCPGSVNSALLQRNPLIAKPHTPIHHRITWTKFVSYQNWKVWPLHSIGVHFTWNSQADAFAFLFALWKLNQGASKAWPFIFASHISVLKSCFRLHLSLDSPLCDTECFQGQRFLSNENWPRQIRCYLLPLYSNIYTFAQVFCIVSRKKWSKKAPRSY